MSDAQETFDWLVPYKAPLLRPDQVAKSLGRSLNHVYDLIQEGRLESHAPLDREKQRYMITRRSVLRVLAETANYEPANHITRVESLLETLTAAELTRLIVAATKLRAKS